MPKIPCSPPETALAVCLDDLDPASLLLSDKRKETTRRAYAGDLAHFFGGAPTPERVRPFVAQPPAAIGLCLRRYKKQMLDAKLAEATVNRRLAAVRALLKLCYQLGVCATDGRNLVANERVRGYRDTRGIDLPALRRLLAAPQGENVGARRDRALLRLLVENGLRRAEVCSTNCSDVDLKRGQLQILGKGKGTQKQAVTISPATVASLVAYLRAAGHRSGPLFRNLSRCPQVAGQRLTPTALYDIVLAYGKAIGVRHLTPHQLRHSAITALLDATNGNVREVRLFSRHVSIETVTRYDDARTDVQGQLTQTLSRLLG